MIKLKIYRIVFFLTMCITLGYNAQVFSQSSDQSSVSDTTLVLELNEAASKLWRSSPDSSRSLALKGLEISESIDFKQGLARSYNNLGALTFFAGKFDSAYYYWNESLVIWEKLEDKSQVSKMLGNVALALNEQNKLAEAIAMNKRAVELRIEINDSLQIAIGYNNLGILYEKLDDLEKAKYFQLTARHLRELIGDSVRLSSSYANLGSVYNLLGDLDSANYFLREALKLKESQNDTWGMASVYGMLTELYYLKYSYDSALYCSNEGLSLAADMQADYLLLELNLWQAKIYLARNQLERALHSINNCQSYLEDQNNVAELTMLHLLAEIHHRKGEFEKAANYFKKYTLKNDSIQKINAENKIAELTAKNFYELREMELKSEQRLKQMDLELQIEQKQLAQSRLIIVLLFIAVLLIVTIMYFIILTRKNQTLDKQRQEIQKLNQQQKEIIEMRTAELLSTKDAITRYAFLNSHELRAPLARILGIIHLSDKEDIDEDTFFNSLKKSARELEEAVRKISDELNKH